MLALGRRVQSANLAPWTEEIMVTPEVAEARDPRCADRRGVFSIPNGKFFAVDRSLSDYFPNGNFKD
jgi:hypothetical protein